MKKTATLIKSLHVTQNQSNILHKPLFYRITQPNDLLAFQALLKTPHIILFDTILSQLKELMKIKNPSKKLTEKDLESLAFEHIGSSTIEEYGVWVYYPWTNRLVHTLDEEEFIEVRTSRNMYKITPEERNILSQKKIGVIGLSVGQSVSVTMAMERIAGELRLADFDTLELTNLNRIRTGVHNLGLAKVYAVAREIAEIDPFLKVSCFPEGLNEQNMDAFFCEGGKLDLLVEESDGFDIKILSRYKAKELGIPVIMEASDRCMVDVERFDIEPKRSILHGLVDHLDINSLKSLKTTEEKIPYMLDILGIETCSARLKASMLEIDQTINTWPQLASAVTMGGGITADVSRRILLNSYTESGRYHIDIEKLIGNSPPRLIHSNKAEVLVNKAIDIKTLAHEVPLVKQTAFIDLNDDEIKLLVTAGSMAPSGGNTQPWRWFYKSNTLMLFQAFDEQSTLLGYGNYSTYVALGAALENISLKSEEINLEAHIDTFPYPKTPQLIACINFIRNKKNTPSPLSKIINSRVTNRNISTREYIAPEKLTTIHKECCSIKGAELVFVSDEKKLNTISELLGSIEQIRLLEKVGHENFVNEIRWSEKEVLETRDGLDIKTIDLSNAEIAGLTVFKNEEVVNLLRSWELGDTFKKLTKKSIDSASAIGILTMPITEKKNVYLNGGRALQRAWLTANSQGIAFQPLASSLFIYERVIEGKGELLSKLGYEKLRLLKKTFDNCFLLNSNKVGVFIFRVSNASAPTTRSLRKHIEDIYTNLNHEH